jgi:RNA polymerase sigma-70 factor (ECF subfamily)
LLHYFAAKLPPKTKQVFLLSRESNLTYKEIAEKLHISIKTVEAQMTRALRKMRSILKEQRFL